MSSSRETPATEEHPSRTGRGELPGHVDLVACQHTLSGVGVAEPARHSFADRVAAASAAGVDIGLTWLDYEHLLAGAHAPKDLRALADDAGVRVVEVEFLNAWWASGERLAAAARHEELVLQMARTFGARHVGVGASVAPADAPAHDLLVERFAGLCDRAAEHGLLVGLEFMPFFVLSDAAMLSEIPADRIVALQLCDVVDEPGWTVLDEALDHRLWPGEGTLDLAGLVAGLLRPGAAFPVEAEVLNAGYRRDPLAVNADHAARAAREVLARAVENRAVENRAPGADRAPGT